MSVNAKKPIINGLILLSGLLLISACVKQQPPFSVVEEEQQPVLIEDSTIIAQLPEEEPVESVVYEPEYPQTYIVQNGDTLWDISSVFLRDPWHWPEIWYKNPQIGNPHLIFPGDELAIIYIGGAKMVQVVRRSDDAQVTTATTTATATATTTSTRPAVDSTTGITIVKLSPRIRSAGIDSSIPSIPIDKIQHLLSRPRLFSKEELDRAAYVISSVDTHLINSVNDKLYVRKLNTSSGNGRYQIFRPSIPLYDPSTGELLGYQALYAGEAKLILKGDPATVQVTNSEREILRNDKVLPIDITNFERDFFPRPPATKIRGELITLLDAISMVGQYQTIAINLGSRDGLGPGTLLRIRRIGDVIPDKAEDDPRFTVKLPDQDVGMAMIIRSSEKLSYALVMSAIQPIHITDYVVSP
jgi:hypothetical protein